MIDKKQVEKIASLARLELTESEVEIFTGQLAGILDYVGRLSEIDTESSPLKWQTLLEKIEMKEDTPVDFPDIEDIRRIAPDFEEGFYRVRKVLE